MDRRGVDQTTDRQKSRPATRETHHKLCFQLLEMVVGLERSHARCVPAKEPEEYVVEERVRGTGRRLVRCTGRHSLGQLGKSKSRLDWAEAAHGPCDRGP